MLKISWGQKPRELLPQQSDQVRWDKAETAEMTIHGAMRRLLTPCLSNSPQLGLAGQSITQKSRAVMEEIAAAMVNGAKVTVWK